MLRLPPKRKSKRQPYAGSAEDTRRVAGAQASIPGAGASAMPRRYCAPNSDRQKGQVGRKAHRSDARLQPPQGHVQRLQGRPRAGRWVEDFCGGIPEARTPCDKNLAAIQQCRRVTRAKGGHGSGGRSRVCHRIIDFSARKTIGQISCPSREKHPAVAKQSRCTTNQTSLQRRGIRPSIGSRLIDCAVWECG